MRIVPLASGSSGNCTLVEGAGRRVLIDVGVSAVEAEELLRAVDVEPRTIDAALFTHRHRDHVRGGTEFCRKHRVRAYAVRRTSRSLGTEVRRRLTILRPSEWCAVGDAAFRVLPIPVEHDAPDTVAFLVEADGARYGHATDLGSAAGAVGDLLTRCDTIYLEFNHDEELLESFPGYPLALKQRIAGPRGHLSNDAAAELLARLVHDGLRRVWVGHVSERTNTAERALAAARRVLPTSVDVRLAARATAQELSQEPT